MKSQKGKILRFPHVLTLAAALTAALAVVLTACGGGQDAQAQVQPAQSNNNGTQAVNISSVSEAAAGGAQDGEVFEIREKMFVSQVNDIYLNAEDYLGKVISYEGIFKEDAYPEMDAVYYYVVRYGPGCCGTDSNPGFEVIWDGDYPKQDEWVEATGILEAYEEDGYQYLRLQLSSLEVMDVRGEEYVSQ
jgi:uncharacterized membrane protein YcgQ (UPF0703/DUF1980 family)